MTPKEKAKELFSKFHIEVLDREGTSAMNSFEAYQCALIAVDEMLKVTSLINDGCGEETTLDYWQEVKTEIEQL